MNDLLERFLKSINCNSEGLESFVVDKVVVKKKEEKFIIYLKAENVVNCEKVLDMLECANSGINGTIKCEIIVNYNNISTDDILNSFKILLNNLIIKKPSLSGLSESSINIDGNTLVVEVVSKAEEEAFNREINNLLNLMNKLGFNDIEIVSELNKDKELVMQEELKKDHQAEEIVEEKTPVFIGKHIDGELTAISSIMGEMKNVIVEAYVFGIDTLEKENINIITLKISDKTNSILAKVFKRDHDEFKSVLKNLKEGNWYRIHGNIEFDNFAKDLVLAIRNMESIGSKDSVVKDDAEVKRVELHAHTFMSTMDGVVPMKALVKYAKKLGHRAVAVTDHNCLQAYPDIYNSIVWDNKDLPDEEKFKVLYGVELNTVNDDVDVIFNPKEFNLLNDTFVVFDTETTGFYAGSDQMIEIGAVKIKNGEIIDRFDELIDPQRPLPHKIVELTCITDDMVKGKDSEENVTRRFLEWAGDLPMVAHNAKFDISFMKAACKKYDLGEFDNTVLDTMSLARILSPEWPNHKLSTLVKKYKVPWDEDAHHRADYDAEGTAHCFYAMAKILDARNIETTMDIYETIDYDELVKFSFPFHLTLIAQTQAGLKNLFKIVSLANTKYLYKNDQPKIPRREINNLREGILVGSGCINGEIFEAAKVKDDEELSTMMSFYDYIEVQPISAMTHLLQMESSGFHSELELQELIKKIVRVAKDAGKLVCATGDVHNLTKEDKIYREIIINQKTNGRLHPLNRRGIDVPNMYFMTTQEMLDAFAFLGEDLAYEIVVTNPNKIADMVDHLQIIKDKLYTPVMENSDEQTRKMVYTHAHNMYGDVLPKIVEDRIEKELHGIISNGYSVLYLIAQKLVKKSNDDGYFVGSRGSVGSSFVATMMGITEVNGLPAHYLCPKCKKSVWEDEEGPFSHRYASGYDLPDRDCEECHCKMRKEGQDIPFATFLGFNAEKVPDIDLNFSGDNQSAAHDYTKVLFGEDKVYRAGTIGTVAEKTAYGYVKAYCEDKGIAMRNIEVERLSVGCTGVKRTTGQHPGGIIVIPDYMDVYDFTAFQYPADEPGSSWYTTHFAFSAIHDNVLKLDILGHDDPTMLRYLGDSTGVDIASIPFDDKGVLSLFTSPKVLGITSEQINCPTGTFGIPEFGTGFTIKMLEETKPTTFAELVKISGLSHGTDVWVGNARDLILNKVVEFKDVIGCRDDILIYLMNQGMDPSKAFKISEFVRKGKASKEPDKWAEFVSDLEAANIPDWFIKSCGKIKYMFPKAHATAYVMMGFRVAWFKVYRPIYYYSAYFSIRCADFDVESMIKGYDAVKAKIAEIAQKGYDATNKEKNVADVLNVALEMLARGFTFKNIDIRKSDATKFVVSEDEKSLIIPFRALDGLGDSVGKKIIEERENQEFISIEDFQNRGKVSATTVDKLRNLGVLDGMPETSQLSLF